jgi:hypothetical protein
VTEHQICTCIDHSARKARQVTPLFAKKQFGSARHILSTSALGPTVERNYNDIGAFIGFENELPCGSKVVDIRLNCVMCEADKRHLATFDIEISYGVLRPVASRVFDP